MSDLKIFVLSLKGRNPRRATFKTHLESVGLTATFVDAIDGRDALPKQWETAIDRAAAMAQERRALSDGEFACALGHRLIYQAFLDSDADWALIFEDDAILDSQITDLVRSKGYQRAPLLLYHHANARVTGTGLPLPGTTAQAFRLAMSPFYAAAYSLNRATARRLLDAQSPVRALADWPVDLADLDGHVVVPPIVGHPPHGPGDLGASDLTGQRQTHRNRSLGHYLSATYLRRKWRKMRSRKVS